MKPGWSLLLFLMGTPMPLLVLLPGQDAFATAGPATFATLQTRPHKDDEGFQGTEVEWQGEAGAGRFVHLVDNGIQDPTGNWGGYARTLSYPHAGALRVCRGNNPDYPGFGMVVNHVHGGSQNSVRIAGGTSELLFAGANHAIYAYHWRYRIRGALTSITVHWLFATGSAAPLYAITYDLMAAAPNQLVADTRAPYGEVAWDGGAAAPINGVAWGDYKKFASLGDVVTLDSGWDYLHDNTVPFTRSFVKDVDAEMGLVQTQTQHQHAAGGYGGFRHWNDARTQGPMPRQSDWPFQLHQWQLPYDTTAKRMAWGSPYGAVGQTSYATLGNKDVSSGYPYQSYAVYVVMDAYSQHAVEAYVAHVEAQQRATLTALEGADVRAAGPGGVGRTDRVAFDVAGYNPVYGTWELDAFAGSERIRFALTAADDARNLRPTFVLHNVKEAQASTVTIDGRLAVAQLDYAMSFAQETNTLWLSLLHDVSGTTEVALQR